MEVLLWLACGQPTDVRVDAETLSVGARSLGPVADACPSDASLERLLNGGCGAPVRAALEAHRTAHPDRPLRIDASADTPFGVVALLAESAEDAGFDDVALMVGGASPIPVRQEERPGVLVLARSGDRQVALAFVDQTQVGPPGSGCAGPPRQPGDAGAWAATLRATLDTFAPAGRRGWSVAAPPDTPLRHLRDVLEVASGAGPIGFAWTMESEFEGDATCAGAARSWAAATAVRPSAPQPPPSDDAAVEAYLADCAHVFPAVAAPAVFLDVFDEGPPQPLPGTDECTWRPFAQNCMGDPGGCWYAGQACADACGPPCVDCQRDCAASCTTCKAVCAGDAACERSCAVDRAACRDACRIARWQCTDVDCPSEALRCRLTP